MKLTLGYSPCPNDTFIFDAMVHGKIDTEGLRFAAQLEDVETLNNWAAAGKLDITKLSYAAFAQLTDRYQILSAGSALGNHCGPLLVAKKAYREQEIPDLRIAVPGLRTTAYFLYEYAFGKLNHSVPTLFSDIEASVLDGRVDAGVIIHENRFTYQQKGLVLLRDLGAHWEDTTGWPIPLGGIVVQRQLPDALKQKIERVMARSVAYAFAHRADVMPYVRAHAQELDEAVIHAHIDLYVNDFTLDLGEKGRSAVLFLLQKAQKAHFAEKNAESIFVTS
jgi:1,4-dihydroxy-6-naphthoate synthase